MSVQFDTAAFPERFGMRLRRARYDKGLSQNKLAGIVGFDPQTISNLERGYHTPSLFTVFVLAVALEVHPKDLLFGEED